MKRLLLLFSVLLVSVMTAQAQKVTAQLTYGMYGTSSDLLSNSELETLQKNDQLKDYGKLDKALASYGAEFTAYIIKGWGINGGIAYSNSSVDRVLEGNFQGMIKDPAIKMYQFNLGVSKKLIKLPLFSLSGIVGANMFSRSFNDIVSNIKDASNQDYKAVYKNENSTKYGLDLGLSARIAFLSATVKHDFTAKYTKFGLGMAF